MKLLFASIILMIIAYKSSISEVFNFIPININFKEILQTDKLTVTYGDFGSALISFENQNNWKQVRVFDQGIIVRIFSYDDNLVAFNNLGDVSISSNMGGSWNKLTKINDTILTVIQYSDGYLIRTPKKLITTSMDFNKKSNYKIFSNELDTNLRRFNYRFSICSFKDKLVIETDSSNILIFDKQLNLIEKVNFRNTELCDDCYNQYQIASDDLFCYFRIDNKIFKTSDFKTFQLEGGLGQFITQYKSIDGQIFFVEYSNTPDTKVKLFCLKNNVPVLVNIFESKKITGILKPKDFIIRNNNWIVCGDNKLLIKVNLKDSSKDLISDFSGNNNIICPEKVEDSTYVFYQGLYNGVYSKYIYHSYNHGVLIKPVLNFHEDINFRYFQFAFKCFDEKNNNLIFGGTDNLLNKNFILKSSDYGANFVNKQTKDIIFNYAFPLSYANKINHAPNIFFNGEYFVYTSSTYYRKAFSSIMIYDSNFVLINNFRDSNFVIQYISSNKINSYFVYCQNTNDGSLDSRYTTNNGSTWNIIKKYSDHDSLLFYKEFRYNLVNYLACCNINKLDSNCYVDIIDLEKYSIKTIYQFKFNNKGFHNVFGQAFAIFKDTFYLSVYDTLFYTNNLFDRKSWKFYILPDNGRIIRTFKKFDNTFFARYIDDKNPDNVYWFTLTETNKTIEKPVIFSEDLNFGKKDIKTIEPLTKVLNIYNYSKESDLLIYTFSLSDTLAFKAEFPACDSINPILIKPDSSFQVEIAFNPKDVRIYQDSLICYSNADSIKSISYLTGEGIDTAISKIDEIEISQSYLFTYPPYPIPAKNNLRTLIYWDASSDIETDEISVFDVEGNKAEGKENITIDLVNTYSGYLRWDCSGVPNGIYLIKIKHGTTTKCIKVIVER